MRVYVVEASGKGGLIHYSYHLSRGLQRCGVETTLVTSTAYELRDLEHPFRVVEFLRLWDPRASKSGNPLWHKARRGLRGLQYIYQWYRLVNFLKREKPDVVLFGEMRFAFETYFLQMLRRSGIKLADIVHDVQAYDTRKGSDKILHQSEKHLAQYNKMYAQFNYLFVHDRSNRELFLKLYDIPAERVFEIPMATNELVLEVKPTYTPEGLRDHLGIPDDRPIVLFFGTITKYKGLVDLIRAFPAIHQATNAQLLIAGFPGKDVDVPELKGIVQSLDMNDYTTWFLDYVPNEWVAPMMEISDVVILPYRAITQSAVIQIAYACGKPVVATRVGGLPDIVEEGKSGLLADPQNPDSLAQAIITALDDKDKLREMGKYARHLAESRYSWMVVGDIIKKAFEKSL